MTAAIKAEALRLGFAAAGVARIEPPGAPGDPIAEAGRRLDAWIERGEHGELDWFERLREERSHPRRMWPGARSLVAVAWNYHRPDEPSGAAAGIARYARGRDYHRAVATRLRALARFARAALPGAEVRVAVDTGPILERPWAERAGIGFIGKHANLVRRDLGKELVLLAWAIEDADPTLISVALANWSGLVPEERWWLYTQTAAATGHGTADRSRGWRKAVRYALTENPVSGQVSSEAVVPETFRRAAGSLFEHLGVAEGPESET